MSDTPALGATDPVEGNDPAQDATPQSSPDEKLVPISELRKLRREAADWRTRYRDLERKSAEDDGAKLAEQRQWQALAEKRQVELEALREEMTVRAAELHESAIRVAVIAAAAKASIADPEDAYKLADLSDVSVEDDDSVSGVEVAIEALVESKPYLLAGGRTRPPSPKPTNPQGSGDAGDLSWFREAISGRAQPFGDGGVSLTAIREGD